MVQRTIAILCVALIMLTAGCSGKKTEQQLLDETLDIIDDSIKNFTNEDSANATETPSPEPSNEPEPTLLIVDLNLPLVTTENTCFDDTILQGYISSDGIFKTGSLYNGWNDIDTDVRSFHMHERGNTVFYIKKDNSLWSYGRNSNGVLGDNTGVDQKEPVKILDDVAIVESFHSSIIALKTDKTLWVWGSGVFSPVLIADGVVDVIGSDTNMSFTVLRSDGLLYRYRYSDTSESELLTGSKPKSLMDCAYAETQVKRFVVSDNNTDSSYWIDLDGALWMGTKNSQNVFDMNAESKIICESGVVGLFPSGHFIKDDNSLWAFGNNNVGQLGDGTKVPRLDEPVKIADDISNVYVNSYSGYYAYLKTNGELWRWNSDNPTPTKSNDDVCSLISLNKVLLNDGRVLDYGGTADGDVEAENVRLPQTITIP